MPSLHVPEKAYLPEGLGYLCLRACQACHCFPKSQTERTHHGYLRTKIDTKATHNRSNEVEAKKGHKRTSSPGFPGGPGGPRAPTGP